MNKKEENGYTFLKGIKEDLKEQFLCDYESIDYFNDWVHEFIDSYFTYYDDELYLDVIKRYQNQYSESQYFMSEEAKAGADISRQLQIGAYQCIYEEIYNDDLINELQNWDDADEDERKELIKKLKEEVE